MKKKKKNIFTSKLPLVKFKTCTILFPAVDFLLLVVCLHLAVRNKRKPLKWHVLSALGKSCFPAGQSAGSTVSNAEGSGRTTEYARGSELCRCQR